MHKQRTSYVRFSVRYKVFHLKERSISFKGTLRSFKWDIPDNAKKGL